MGWCAGIADIATDFLTADQSTMMSTPVTFLSASVTVPEQGDTVIVSVSGRWEWMGSGLFVLDQENPDSVWTCTLALVCTEANLPSGVGVATGITNSGGMLYVSDNAAPGEQDSVWTCTLALVCTEANLPSGVGDVEGITATGGMLYVADSREPDSVWTCTLALVCTEANLPSFFSDTTGITASGGMLYVADIASVWTCTLALVCTEANLPSGVGSATGITASGGMLYVALTLSVGTCTLALSCTEAEPAERSRSRAGHHGHRRRAVRVAHRT